MIVVVVADPDGGGRLRVLGEAGTRTVTDLAGAVGDLERTHGPRWVLAGTAALYPRLLRAGVGIGRVHDVELTEGLLLGYAGRHGEPRGLPAIWARRHDRPVPPDPAVPEPGAGDQPALFEDLPTPAPGGFDPVDALAEAYADQLARTGATEHPERFRLLVAAESAGGLAGAEMGHHGLPWRADTHDELLRELLGEPSPVAGAPPARLVELTERIRAAFGGARVQPESPADVLRAFAREGVTLPSTRAWVLREVDHPAVPLLLEFKELYRLWTAHGWAWRQRWVRDGRFHGEYVPGGVVSGRWATRGGGALQIPKVVRRAVVADDGWVFVVADAAQLEPRVLAAVAGDARLAEAAAAGDLYEALAASAFGGDRARAKVALLGAMYGQTGGAAVPALAALRARFPTAWDYVERAARTGESGGVVRSWLGRTCPGGGARDRSPEAARARGRFTRNFVIQATASEWALTLLAGVRRGLRGTPAQLVFFQHDEIVVHAPADRAGEVVAAVAAAGDQARSLLFGDTPVRFPLEVSTVRCYADAK